MFQNVEPWINWKINILLKCLIKFHFFKQWIVKYNLILLQYSIKFQVFEFNYLHINKWINKNNILLHWNVQLIKFKYFNYLKIKNKIKNINFQLNPSILVLKS